MTPDPAYAPLAEPAYGRVGFGAPLASLAPRHSLEETPPMSQVNRYAGTCVACKGPVPARGGMLTKVGRRYELRHDACKDGAAVTTFRFSSGATLSVNARGRCEDAPCCGCCS